MEAFMNSGRYYDQTSEIAYEWRAEHNNLNLETALHMRATRFGKTTLITAVFTDQEMRVNSEDDLIREAMFRAERQLNTGAAAPVENTRGVLRHLVQMARAAAA